jgi:hypothetical protein
VNQNEYSGCVVSVPSTKRWRGLIPITPPHVRIPTSGPKPYSLKQWLKMSPSLPANWFVTATIGPATDSSGYGNGGAQRETS